MKTTGISVEENLKFSIKVSLTEGYSILFGCGDVAIIGYLPIGPRQLIRGH